MRETIIHKIRRPLALILAVLMTVAGMPEYAVYAGEKKETPEQYEVHLPAYRGCAYSYDNSHVKSSSSSDVVLLYEKEEHVQISVNMEKNYQVQEVHVYGSGAQEIPIQWGENHELAFFMPDQDVSLSMKLVEEKEETEDTEKTEKTEEAETECITEVASEEAMQKSETSKSDVKESVSGAENDVPGEDEDSIQGTDRLENEEDASEMEVDKSQGGAAAQEIETMQQEEKEENVFEIETDQLKAEETISETEMNTPKREIAVSKAEIIELEEGKAVLETETGQQEEYVLGTEINESKAKDENVSETEINMQEDEEENLPEEDDAEEQGDGYESDAEKTVIEKEKSEIRAEESETEKEQKEDSEEKEYTVMVPEDEDVSISVESNCYKAGEEVQVMVQPEKDTVVYGVEANTSDGQSINCEAVEESSGETALTYSFEMPSSDVVLGVESERMLLAEPLAVSASKEQVLTSVYFKRGSAYFYASAIASGGGENMKQVTYKYSDGTDVETVAYCLQNRVHGSPAQGDYSSELHELDASSGKELLLRKALFYCYGGPGWGRTFSGINIKKVMSTYGLSGSNDYYYATHNLSSYIYSGKWSSYLNARGVSLMKELVSSLNDLPDPSVCELSREKLTATQGATDSITYKAADENTATLTLPSGVTLVNDKSGKTYTGTVKISGGTKFHLEASTDKALVGNYEMKTKYGANYEAYAIRVSGVQDVGFAAASISSGTLAFVVEKGEATQSVYVRKESDDPNNWLKKYSNLYDLEGVEFTFYADKDKKKTLGRVIVDEDGKSGTLKIEMGTAEKKTVYYQETARARGHIEDRELHSLVLDRNQEEPIEIKAVNHVMYVIIDGAIVKQDDKGNPLAGAQIKVHFYGEDSSYSEEKTSWVFETGSNGKMMVSNSRKISGPTIPVINGTEVFPKGYYAFEEIKAPEGYQIDDGNNIIYKKATAPSKVEGHYTNPKITMSSSVMVNTNGWKVKVKKVSSNPAVTDDNDRYTLKGAVFGFYDEKGTLLGTRSTDDDGCTPYLELENISEQAESVKITVKEEKAPKGFVLNTAEKTVTLTKEKPSRTVTYKDEPIFTDLKIRKSTTEPVPGISLSDCIFGIYSDESCADEFLVQKLRTLSDGCTDILELEYGTYWVKEVSCPPTFKMNTQIKKVSLTKAREEVVELKFANEPIVYPVSVKKVSVSPEITNGNSCYSFTGAKFHLATDPSMEHVIATLEVKDETGVSEAVKVTNGTYYVQEAETPKGYKRNTEIKKVIVSGKAEMVEIADEPIIGTIHKLLEKKANGLTNRSLAGAKFEVKFYGSETVVGTPQRTWVLQTIKEKDTYVLNFSKESYVSGDSFYTYKNQQVLPLGCITFREIKAPDGFQINPNLFTSKITENKTNDNADVVYQVPVVTDEPSWGGVKISKVCAESGQTPQGNASLAGAVFSITSLNQFTVIRKDTGKEYEYGDEIAAITTGEDGIARIGAVLQAGTYRISEKTAPQGYMISDQTVDFTIIANGEVVDMTGTPVADEIVRGGVKIAKWDLERNEAVPQGEAVLEGAEFTLLNKSANAVYVDTDGDGVREKYEPSQVITVLKTDDHGIAETDGKFLPCGRYQVKETKPPVGYTTKGEHLDWQFTVSGKAEDNGTIYEYATADTAAKNEPIHFDIDLFKFKDTLTSEDPTDRMTALNGIRFTIKNVSEHEVVVRGKRYQPQEIVMTIVTDAYGFATTSDHEDNCASGALPYGKYEIHEENCPEGLRPVRDFVVDGTMDGGVYDGKTYKGIYLNDVPMESRIRIRKVDSETGKVISQGATFQILDEEKNVIDFLVTYPTASRITEFTTNEEGVIETPTKLPYGTYYLREIDPPYDREEFRNGYVLEEDLQFRVDQNNAWEDVIEVTYPDTPAKGNITVTKTDADTKEKIAGAVFAVFADEDIVTGDGTLRHKKGEQVDIFTVDEEGIGSSKPLYLGAYHLQEVKAPRGYCLDTKVYPFVLTYDKTRKEMEVIHETMQEAIENRPTVLKLFKEDVDGQALDGITFQLERIGGESDSGIENEKAVSGGTFITADGGKLEVRYLISGIYSLHEVETLPGYVLDDAPRYVTVDANGFIYESDEQGDCLNTDGARSDTVSLHWVNDYTKWDFSKVDATGDKELPGAELEIYDSEGNLVEKWISTEEIHRVNKLPVGIYTLVEKTAPDGYVAASEVIFEVTDTGIIQKETMIDKQVWIHKTDITGEKELPGAKLTVTDPEGNVVDEWISAETPHPVRNLTVGQSYVLREDAAPAGYATSSEISFTVTDDGVDQVIIMKDDVTKVEISKKDITNEEELPGAHLILQDAAGNTAEEWISAETPHYIEKLPVGEYTLTEITAPEGYDIAEKITFIVRDTGEIQHVTMYDTPKEIEVETEPESEFETETEMESENESETETEMESEITSERATETESEIASEAETEIESETESETEITRFSNSPKKPEDRKDSVSRGVKTGDHNRYIPAILLIAAGICLFLFLKVTGKRKE